MTAVKTAMVLAAGQGERMRPLTSRIPKPLVSLAGKALIDHVLDRLRDAGVDTAIVNVHYLADTLEAHLQTRGMLPAIVISDERESLLDTGGGALKALPLLGAGPFYIHNSDSVWAEGALPALPAMASAWDPARMDCLLLLAPIATSLGFDGRGDFDMDAHGRLSRRGDRASVPYAFAGASICDERLFADAPSGAFSLNLLWDRAMEKGRLYGFPLQGRWMHVGTVAALEEAEEAFEREGA